MTGSQKKQDSGTLDVMSPFDGTLIDTVAKQGLADAEEMLDKALALHRNRD